ncbi:MAG: hypothetical protein H7067_13890 [Burkholderiales bacterium]|nr:hypothetical protein [Opitutaceae bacterium]
MVFNSATLRAIKPGALRGWGVGWLLFWVTLIYHPVLGYDFVFWDDNINLMLNPLLHQDWSWSGALGFFWGADGSVRFKPLHWLLLRVWHGWFGFEAWAWHALGFILHGSSAVLAYVVVGRLYRRLFPVAGSRLADVVALLGVTIWLAHPLRVEPVAWVTGSAYPFATVFTLGSLGLYLRSVEAAGRRRRWFWIGAWLMAICAYCSYSITLTLGLFLMVLDVLWLRIAPACWWNPRHPESRAWWGRHLAFVLPAVLALAVTLMSKGLSGGRFPKSQPLSAFSDFGERIETGAASLASFPLKLFFPFDLTSFGSPVLDRGTWIGIGILALVVLPAAFWLARALRSQIAGLASFYVGFGVLALPCLGLTEVPIMPPDRYSYLVDLVLVGGLGGLLLFNHARFFAGWRWVAGGVCACVFLLCCLSSSRLLPVWRDTDTLFTHMTAGDSLGLPMQRTLIYRNWSYYAVSKGRPDEAAAHVSKALQIYRDEILNLVIEGNQRRAVYFTKCQLEDYGFTFFRHVTPLWWCENLGLSDADLPRVQRIFDTVGDDVEIIKQLCALKCPPPTVPDTYTTELIVP